MKVTIAVLVVLIIVLSVICMCLVATRARGIARRDEYQRAREKAHAAGQNLLALEITMDAIEGDLDNYSDIESPLAATVRQRIREYRRGRIV